MLRRPENFAGHPGSHPDYLSRLFHLYICIYVSIIYLFRTSHASCFTLSPRLFIYLFIYISTHGSLIYVPFTCIALPIQRARILVYFTYRS